MCFVGQFNATAMSILRQAKEFCQERAKNNHVRFSTCINRSCLDVRVHYFEERVSLNFNYSYSYPEFVELILCLHFLSLYVLADKHRLNQLCGIFVKKYISEEMANPRPKVNKKSR